MTTKNLTVIDATIQGMKHAEMRNTVIAKNIANADTAGYKAQDIKALDFKSILKNTSSTGSISAATTNSKHLTSGGGSSLSGKVIARDVKDTYEVSPTGNSVVLEEQLMNMQENFIDHRLYSTIYKRQMQMLERSIK